MQIVSHEERPPEDPFPEEDFPFEAGYVEEMSTEDDVVEDDVAIEDLMADGWADPLDTSLPEPEIDWRSAENADWDV
jgi:hypothetical protein